MRTIYSVVLVMAAVGFSAAPLAAQAGPKWGFINSQRLLAEAPGSQEAQQALEQDMSRFRSELEKLESELQTMISEYEQQQTMMSMDARQKREQEIRAKDQAYRQRAMELEQQAARRQQEVIEPIMTRIREVIDQMREEGNYAMIFDVAAGAIIAVDPALDLTDEVLARLRSTASNASGQ